MKDIILTNERIIEALRQPTNEIVESILILLITKI